MVPDERLTFVMSIVEPCIFGNTLEEVISITRQMNGIHQPNHRRSARNVAF